MQRNCHECGEDFSTDSNERKCHRCRKQPSAHQRWNLSMHLSPREKQVVNLISKGCANKAIAFELHLSQGTIKEYVHRIFRKVGVNNRTELAVWALTNAKPAPVQITDLAS